MIDTGASGSAGNEVIRKVGLIAALLALILIVWMTEAFDYAVGSVVIGPPRDMQDSNVDGCFRTF